MHLFFIDESGSLPPKGKHKCDDKFVLGGIIISEDTWFKIDSELRTLKRKYSVNEEIKRRYFYQSKDRQTPLSHLDEGQKERFRTDIFRIVARRKSIKVICAVADISQCFLKAYIRNDDELYWYAYKQLPMEGWRDMESWN